MELEIVDASLNNVALLKSEEKVVGELQDALDLIGNAKYLGAQKIIVSESNFTEEFFDLKTKLAGEILQKFSTYDMYLAIAGDYSKFNSKSLQDFIRESNEIGRIL